MVENGKVEMKSRMGKVADSWNLSVIPFPLFGSHVPPP